MDSIKFICLIVGLAHVTNAGFLQSPFQYIVNPGAPITSAASPYFHGFGAPLVSPLVNFYHHQPLLKFFQPVFYHQPPQFFNLPTPQFYTLPETTPTSAPVTGYGPPKEQEEQKVAEPQPPVYGPPPPSASENQFQPSSPSGFNNQDTGDRFSSGPSGFGNRDKDNRSPSGPPGFNTGNRFSSGSSGFNNQENRFSGPSGSSPKLQVYEDDFGGDKESVFVDANGNRESRAPPSNDNFQSFIANSRDNSVRDGQERRPFSARPGTRSSGGY